MTDADFDGALAALPPLRNASRKPNRRSRRIQKKIDEQLTLALADPSGWATANRDAIRRAARRPRIAAELREAPELAEFDEQAHADGVAWLTGDTSKLEAMSEERKAKLHKWIERAIPFLKILAAVVPPPWNMGVIALIVFLMIFDQRRLTPAEVAAIMSVAA